MTRQETITLPNVEVHTACRCYQKGDERTIMRYDLASDSIYSFQLDSHRIIFLLDGEMRIIAHNIKDGVTLCKNSFVFLSVGARVECRAQKSCSMMMIKLENIVGQIPECETFRFHRAKALVNDSHDSGLYPLVANSRIQHLMEGLAMTEGDGLKCSSYAQLIVAQLLFLIQVYFPQGEYTRFFSTIISPDILFHDFVIKNRKEFITVNELADAMNMTLQQFTLKFRKILGENPGAWLKKRTAEDVYHDLCSSHKTLKSIALEHGFSPPNFVRYCRMNFGETPKAIRDRLSGSVCGELR